jgi:hypothetical protein
MFLMRADALRGEVGPSEIARADRRVQLRGPSAGGAVNGGVGGGGGAVKFFGAKKNFTTPRPTAPSPPINLTHRLWQPLHTPNSGKY